MKLFEVVNDAKGNAGGCGETGQVLLPAPFLPPLATIGINMNDYESEKDCEGKRYCEDIGIRV